MLPAVHELKRKEVSISVPVLWLCDPHSKQISLNILCRLNNFLYSLALSDKRLSSQHTCKSTPELGDHCILCLPFLSLASTLLPSSDVIAEIILLNPTSTIWTIPYRLPLHRTTKPTPQIPPSHLFPALVFIPQDLEIASVPWGLWCYSNQPLSWDPTSSTCLPAGVSVCSYLDPG